MSERASGHSRHSVMLFVGKPSYDIVATADFVINIYVNLAESFNVCWSHRKLTLSIINRLTLVKSRVTLELISELSVDADCESSASNDGFNAAHEWVS